MYVISVDVYACTKTKAAKHQAPAKIREAILFQIQGPPVKIKFIGEGWVIWDTFRFSVISPIKHNEMQNYLVGI